MQWGKKVEERHIKRVKGNVSLLMMNGIIMHSKRALIERRGKKQCHRYSAPGACLVNLHPHWLFWSMWAFLTTHRPTQCPEPGAGPQSPWLLSSLPLLLECSSADGTVSGRHSAQGREALSFSSFFRVHLAWSSWKERALCNLWKPSFLSFPLGLERVGTVEHAPVTTSREQWSLVRVPHLRILKKCPQITGTAGSFPHGNPDYYTSLHMVVHMCSPWDNERPGRKTINSNPNWAI